MELHLQTYIRRTERIKKERMRGFTEDEQGIKNRNSRKWKLEGRWDQEGRAKTDRESESEDSTRGEEKEWR